MKLYGPLLPDEDLQSGVFADWQEHNTFRTEEKIHNYRGTCCRSKSEIEAYYQAGYCLWDNFVISFEWFFVLHLLVKNKILYKITYKPKIFCKNFTKPTKNIAITVRKVYNLSIILS